MEPRKCKECGVHLEYKNASAHCYDNHICEECYWNETDEANEEQKVIEAIKVIKEYCRESKCEDCAIKLWCTFDLNELTQYPEYWVIEE